MIKEFMLDMLINRERVRAAVDSYRTFLRPRLIARGTYIDGLCTAKGRELHSAFYGKQRISRIMSLYMKATARHLEPDEVIWLFCEQPSWTLVIVAQWKAESEWWLHNVLAASDDAREIKAEAKRLGCAIPDGSWLEVEQGPRAANPFDLEPQPYPAYL